MHCRLLLISLAKRGAPPTPQGRLVPPRMLPAGALSSSPSWQLRRQDAGPSPPESCGHGSSKRRPLSACLHLQAALPCRPPCSRKHGVCRLASVCASSDKETMLLALREDSWSKIVNGVGGWAGVGALACRAGDSLGEVPGRSSNGCVARPDGVHFRCVKGS